MEKTKQKHYFVSVAVITSAAFLFLGILIPLVDPGIEPTPEQLVQPIAIEEATSDSSMTESLLPHLESENKGSREVASIPKAFSGKQKKIERNPNQPRFLNKSSEDYFWQPNVYAIRDLANSKSGKYLGKFSEFAIIDSASEPKEAFPLLWSKKHQQFGRYQGKVIVLGEAPTLKNFLKSEGHRFSNLSGSFIIDVHNLSEAFAVVKNIKKKFPRTLVDLDVTLARSN